MVSKNTKRLVFERAKGLCEYCLCPASHSSSSFSIEHILPIAIGGENSFENLACSCQGCNNLKYIKTTCFDIVTKNYAPIFNPRLHTWEEHFCWDSDFLTIIGLTPIGRGTVILLQLNRESVVNLRSILILGNLHPPV